MAFEPVKEIYAEMIAEYPDLIEFAKHKKKRSLKPVVLYQSDIEALEAQMVKTFGTDSLHKAVIWRQVVEDQDETMRGRRLA